MKKRDRRVDKRRYYLRNKPKILKSSAIWAANNRAKTRTYGRAFYRRNIKKERARSREYAKRNPHRIRLRASIRRALKARLIHPLHSRAKEALIIRRARTLTKQSGIVHTVDHIIPLIAGGWHHHDNLQVLPAGINSSKNDNPFWYEPGYKTWRDVPRHLWPMNLVPQYEALITMNQKEV